MQNGQILKVSWLFSFSRVYVLCNWGFSVKHTLVTWHFTASRHLQISLNLGRLSTKCCQGHLVLSACYVFFLSCFWCNLECLVLTDSDFGDDEVLEATQNLSKSMKVSNISEHLSSWHFRFFFSSSNINSYCRMSLVGFLFWSVYSSSIPIYIYISLVL